MSRGVADGSNQPTNRAMRTSGLLGCFGDGQEGGKLILILLSIGQLRHRTSPVVRVLQRWYSRVLTPIVRNPLPALLGSSAILIAGIGIAIALVIGVIVGTVAAVGLLIAGFGVDSYLLALRVIAS